MFLRYFYMYLRICDPDKSFKAILIVQLFAFCVNNKTEQLTSEYGQVQFH